MRAFFSRLLALEPVALTQIAQGAVVVLGLFGYTVTDGVVQQIVTAVSAILFVAGTFYARSRVTPVA